MSRNNEPRYFDYYGMMTYKDFLAHVAAGTLTTLYVISQGEEHGLSS